MSFLRRSLIDTSQLLVRRMSSKASGATPDPRSCLLEVPRKTNLNFVKETTEDSHSIRQTPSQFVKHRESMKKQFPEGWNPPRKLSREAMEGLRALHLHDPETFTTPVLASRFRISPEAVRRILKSTWVPTKKEKADLLQKERRRKVANIAKRIEKEREDKWAQFDSLEEAKKPPTDEDDELTLV